MKKLRQEKSFRTMVWNILVIVLTYLITVLGNVPREIAPVLVMILRAVIKYINVNLLWDLGVEEE